MATPVLPSAAPAAATQVVGVPSAPVPDWQPGQPSAQHHSASTISFANPAAAAAAAVFTPNPAHHAGQVQIIVPGQLVAVHPQPPTASPQAAAAKPHTSSMPYTSNREVVCRSTFIPQLILSACINFGINFGLGWGTYSNWGGRHHDYDTWPVAYAVKSNPDTNSSILSDMAITAVLLPFFCTLFGTGGAVKDVKDRKVQTIDPDLLKRGLWRFTTVRVRNLFLRSLLTAMYIFVLVGIPSFLIVWAAVGNGHMTGLNFVIFKGLWTFFMAVPVFPIVYFAALDARGFPEFDFSALVALNTGKDGDESPLVGRVGHV